MDWTDKSVLITGGTGSFGKRFVDIMLRDYKPRRLAIFSRDELKQHEMRQTFPDSGGSPMRYFIGDVRDRDRLERAFSQVDIVIHAAALKQVPACEYNPFEAIKTNVLGAKNVIDAAIDCNVKKVLAISTDKAVNPINLYGATKLCSEKMFVQANAYSRHTGSQFFVARYGNVVGSRGSVIPLFKQQSENGCITVTDPRMTRFWITLDQGVQFVIKCVEKMHGGEICVPKIPSMKITDLAEAVAPECRHDHIGIRPGEKLHEVLLSEDEARQSVELEDMYVILPLHPWWRVEHFNGADKLPDGFRYSSDTNSQWLSVKDLGKMIE
jgi:UDP-N-acetylglucosamine 4,6-dehydratase/5-epimerase